MNDADIKWVYQQERAPISHWYQWNELKILIAAAIVMAAWVVFVTGVFAIIAQVPL